MSFQSKNSGVQGRQLKVQRLVIPFTLTASATPSAVVLGCDEPNIMFLQSEGKDQITAAVTADSDTATFTDTTPDDSDGELNIFIQIHPGDVCSKVLRARMVSRATGVSQPVKLGSSTGISTKGNIMLTLDSGVDHSTTNVDGCIEVEYIVAE